MNTASPYSQPNLEETNFRKKPINRTTVQHGIQTGTNVKIKNSILIMNFITWILYQIIMYTNKVKLVAGYNKNPSHLPPLPNPLPCNWMNKLTKK